MSHAEREVQIAQEEHTKKLISAWAQINKALKTLGLPVDTDENFLHTARRWVKYIESYSQAYDPVKDLEITFPLRGTAQDVYDRTMIVQVGIPYRAVCAHHLLPVLGTAHVGYIPKERVVGISKLSRLVYGISHTRPSLQEDVCHSITAHLMQHLEPIGAMCVISAEHGCMAARGIEEASGCIQTVTSSVKGVFIEKIDAREEFYQLAALGQ